jgi:hypothetical protein
VGQSFGKTPTGIATMVFALSIAGAAFYDSLGSRELLSGVATKTSL